MAGRVLVTLALVVLVGLAPRSAYAQIYRWVDDAGVPHYVEGLDNVPERHRATAPPLGLRSRPAAPAAADAGASRSTPAGRLVGVTGDDQVRYVMVDSLEVGGARAGRMPIGAYEMVQMEGDGLLGRDFLDAFHVTINAARGLVTLSPK